MVGPETLTDALTLAVITLSGVVVSLAGVIAYLYRENKAEATANRTRIEALLGAATERERDDAERGDRLEDLLLTLTEIAKQPRTRATTDPKKPKDQSR